MMAGLAFGHLWDLDLLCSYFIASFGWAALHHIMKIFFLLKHPAVHQKLCQVESDLGKMNLNIFWRQEQQTGDVFWEH